MTLVHNVVKGIHFVTIVFLTQDSHVNAMERSANAAVMSSGVLDASLHALGGSRAAVHEQHESLLRKETVLRGTTCSGITCPAGSHPDPQYDTMVCEPHCDTTLCCKADTGAGGEPVVVDRSVGAESGRMELWVYSEETCHHITGGLRLPFGASLEDGNCQRAQDAFEEDRQVNAAMGVVVNLMVTCKSDGDAQVSYLYGDDCINTGPESKHLDIDKDVAASLGEGHCVEATNSKLDIKKWVQIENVGEASALAWCIKSEAEKIMEPAVQTVARMVGFGVAADEAKGDKEKKHQFAGLHLNDEEFQKLKIAAIAILPVVWLCLSWCCFRCCCRKRKKKKKLAQYEGAHWGKGTWGKGTWGKEGWGEAKGKGSWGKDQGKDGWGEAKGKGSLGKDQGKDGSGAAKGKGSLGKEQGKDGVGKAKGKGSSGKEQGKDGSGKAKGEGSVGKGQGKEGQEDGEGKGESSDSGEASAEEKDQVNEAGEGLSADEDEEGTAKSGGMFSRFMPK